MRLIKILTILFLLVSRLALTQERKWDYQVIEDLIEELAENNDEELDYTTVTENLYYYFENPLNLNIASEEELFKIPILNTFQIRSLLDFRKIHGPFYSIYELQLVEGFSPHIIQKILPFVTVEKLENAHMYNFRKALKYGRHELLSRVSSVIEDPVGYNPTGDDYYLGNRIQFLNKYRYNYRQKLLWGVTTEKDPGEQFFIGNQKRGFDFYSAYIQVKDLGILDNFVVGDYQIQLGQGLVMWSYIGNRKSTLVLDTRLRSQGIKKYSSAEENSFLRGSAATVSIKNFSLTAFGSLKKLDANTVYDSVLNQRYFTSYQLTGIHALDNQVEDKDAVQEFVIGGNINYRNGNFNSGVSWVNYKYDIPFQKDNSPARQFDFYGCENYVSGINLDYRLKAMHVFAEAAMSKNGGKALVAGTLLQLTAQFNASILYRNFEKNYQSHYANAFGEGSSTQNEQGFYVGAEIHPYRNWMIAAYYDFFKFPWLKTGVSGPSDGNDFLVQTDYQVNRNLNMYWRVKHERKQSNLNDADTGIETMGNNFKTTVRYQVNYRISEQLTLKNRLAYTQIIDDLNEKEQGFLIYQDIKYAFDQLPLQFTLRYALFDTESFASRMYAYENDVYQAFTVPAFYDKGNRMYLLLQYEPWGKLTCWLKIAQTYYTNKTIVGSGLNEIYGNTKTDVRLQLGYKF